MFLLSLQTVLVTWNCKKKFCRNFFFVYDEKNVLPAPGLFGEKEQGDIPVSQSREGLGFAHGLMFSYIFRLYKRTRSSWGTFDAIITKFLTIRVFWRTAACIWHVTWLVLVYLNKNWDFKLTFKYLSYYLTVASWTFILKTIQVTA